jgi:hypothetical protein
MLIQLEAASFSETTRQEKPNNNQGGTLAHLG